MKKRFNKKLVILPAILAFGGVATSLQFLHENKNSTVLKTDASFDNNVTKANGEVNGFSDYSIMYSSNTIGAVVTSVGMVGLSTDNKTITFTTYDGVLVWSKKIADDAQVKEFYKTEYSKQDNDIANYTVQNYIYLQKDDVLAVLFGEKDNKNQILFGISMANGEIFAPIKTQYAKSIVKAADGVSQLYLNSSNNIIGTSGKQFSDYSAKTQIFTMNSSQGVSQVRLPIQSSISKENKDDYFVSYVKGHNNVNFAFFIESNVDNGKTNEWKTYLLAIDDNLVPILNGSNQKITINLDNFKNSTSTKNTQFINWEDVIRYQSEAIISTVNNVISFVSILSGENSFIYKLEYSTSSKNLTKKWAYNFNGHNDTIYNYVFDYTSKSLYFSNKTSKDSNGDGKGARATGYFKDTDLSNTNNNAPTPTILEYDRNNGNWDNNTGKFTNPIVIAPVIVPTNVTLKVSKPYLIIKKNSDPEGRYFKNSTDIYITKISFKKYEDPTKKLKDHALYKDKASTPSYIMNQTSTLLGLLNFTNSFVPSIAIDTSKTKANDDAGTLYYEYKVTYNNWYDSSTKTSFNIPVSVGDLYQKKSNFSFSFVTTLTGNDENDKKYKKIQELKESKFASQITVDEIKQNFINYDIKGKDGNKINDSSIKISKSSSGTRLRVTVTITDTKLPNGINNFSSSYNFDGFKTVDGYDFTFVDTSDSINGLKKEKFPTELTTQEFLDNFVVLGSKWDTNATNWKLDKSPDVYNGSLYVKLEYIGSDLPSDNSVSKDVYEGNITGFKNVPEQFKDKLKMKDVKNQVPSELWELYEKNNKNSLLYQSIEFPYISNNDYLEIKALNDVEFIDEKTEETVNQMDIDGYIELSIGIKDNAQTTLSVPNTSDSPYFIYNSDAKNAFSTYYNDAYPFTIKWNVTKSDETFSWILPNGETTQKENIEVDLNKDSYKTINNQMYADDVTLEQIIELIETNVLESIKVSMFSDNSNGVLKVIVNILDLAIGGNSFVQRNSDKATNNNNSLKTMTITNFKVPNPPWKKYLEIALYVILGVSIASISVAIVVYSLKKHKYKK